MEEKPEKEQQRSRHIPSAISKAVMERHFFECAWCCNDLTERHHIHEWSLGGEHSEANLILLCPNCHTKAHKGEITEDELRKCKSNHVKGYRRSGNFKPNISKQELRIGGNTFLDVKYPIVFRNQPILTFSKQNGNLMMDITLFDADQNLVFWMRGNMYWRPKHFQFIEDEQEFIIRDKKQKIDILKIVINKEFLDVSLNTYLDKSELTVKPCENLRWKDEYNYTYSNCRTENTTIGFWFAKTSNKEFARVNNQPDPVNFTEHSTFETFGNEMILDPKGIKKIAFPVPTDAKGVPLNEARADGVDVTFNFYNVIWEKNGVYGFVGGYLIFYLSISGIDNISHVQLYFKTQSSSTWGEALILVPYKKILDNWSPLPDFQKLLPDINKNNFAAKKRQLKQGGKQDGYLVVKYEKRLNGLRDDKSGKLKLVFTDDNAHLREFEVYRANIPEISYRK